MKDKLATEVYHLTLSGKHLSLFDFVEVLDGLVDFDSIRESYSDIDLSYADCHEMMMELRNLTSVQS